MKKRKRIHISQLAIIALLVIGITTHPQSVYATNEKETATQPNTYGGGATQRVGTEFKADITNNEGLPTEQDIECLFKILTLGEDATPGTVQVGDGYYPAIDRSTQGTITIPEKVSCDGKEYKVTAIGNYAFRGCTGLTSTGLGNNVTITEIGEWAFQGCTGLTSTGLTSNTKLTKIGNSAFYDCTGLTSTGLESNNTITEIGNGAFIGCTSLKSTGLESNTTTTKIGNNAFDGCTSLTSTGLGNNATITEIDESAFMNCTSLTSTGLEKNTAITKLSNQVFAGCTGLTSTGLEKNTTITEIGIQAFVGCTSLGEIIFEVPTLPTMGREVFFDSNVKVYYLEGVTNPEVLENQGAVSIDSLTLNDIGIKTQPKTEYTAGEEFDGSGLVLTREYKITGTENVKELDLVYEAAKNEISFDKTVLTEADKEVMISYKGKSIPLAIHVEAIPPITGDIQITPVEGSVGNQKEVVNTGDSTTLVSYGMMGMLGIVGMYKMRRSKKNI